MSLMHLDFKRSFHLVWMKCGLCYESKACGLMYWTVVKRLRAACTIAVQRVCHFVLFICSVVLVITELIGVKIVPFYCKF